MPPVEVVEAAVKDPRLDASVAPPPLEDPPPVPPVDPAAAIDV